MTIILSRYLQTEQLTNILEILFCPWISWNENIICKTIGKQIEKTILRIYFPLFFLLLNWWSVTNWSSCWKLEILNSITFFYFSGIEKAQEFHVQEAPISWTKKRNSWLLYEAADQGKTPEKISKKSENEFILDFFHFQGNKEVLEQLLKSDVDVNFRCSFGSTPLHAASKNGKLKILNSLVDFYFFHFFKIVLTFHSKYQIFDCFTNSIQVTLRLFKFFSNMELT